MALEADDEVVAQPVEIDRLIGDLAQRDDRILVVVAIDGELGASGHVAGPLSRHHHQIETVGHLQYAVFDRNARHGHFLVGRRFCGP